MKYLHVIINHSVTAPFIELINKNFNSEEHVFYVIRGWSEEKVKIPVCENVYPINNLYNILNGFRLLIDMNLSKKIFFHSLFSPFLLLSLFFQPWLLKKSGWIIWGGDLHLYSAERKTFKGKLEEYIRRRVIRNFSEIITSIKGDYELAKEWYKVKSAYRCAMYAPPLQTKDIDKIVGGVIDTISSDTICIQIGNSATKPNNHFEILNSLKKFQSENIKIYALLAYGEEAYADEVIVHGKAIFGDNFFGIKDYLQFKDFVLFMNRMNIIIFNHERQQAVGNLLLAMYLKKKIFMNEKSTLWEFFERDNQMVVSKTQNLLQMNFNSFKGEEETILENNKKRVENVLGEKYFVDSWRVLFDK